MKKRLVLFFALMLALLLAASLVSCTAASATATLVFADASGSGSLTATVAIPPDNGAYLKDAQKLAEKLDSVVDEMTQTENVYKVEYKGKSENNEYVITMTYSFTDINDYNKKTMRLFNCVPISRRNSVSNSMSREYAFASWEAHDNGDGTFDATFTQDGYMFTVMNLWAYDYLLNNDIEGVWDNTGDGQAAQLSLYTDEDASTIVRATKNVTLSIGDSAQTVAAINGTSAVGVTGRGKVSGAFVAVDTSVTDEDLIVAKPAPDGSEAGEKTPKQVKNIHPMITGAVALIAVIAVAAAAFAAGRKKEVQDK